MRKSIFVLIVFMLMLNMAGCQRQGSIPVNDETQVTDVQLTMKEKMEDFESMYRVLEENYPFFDVNKRMNGVDWLANKDRYVDMINLAMTEQQYKDALEGILEELNNKHTNIINMDFYNYAKVAYEGHKGESDAWLEQLNKPKSVIRYLDNNDLQKQSESSKNQANDYINPYNVSWGMLNQQVAYLSIASLNPFNIEQDIKVIRPFLESVRNYEALIIDIRGNGGGDSSYWQKHLVPMLIDKAVSWKTYFAFRGGKFSEPFINARLINIELKPIGEIVQEKLSNTPKELLDKFKFYKEFEEVIEPKDSVGFKGKIYMLVDRNVYSSSEMFASFAKNTGFATLVGENTGGDGIGQDPMMYSLPNSGYILRFPGVMGLTADGSCNEEHKTEPDIKVVAERKKDISNDQAIQYVLNLHK